MKSRIFICIGLVFSLLSSIVHADIGNPGFENGLTSWSEDSSADIVTVVGSEGSENATVYADFGIDVTPYIGDSALRLGSVMNINEHHNRGDNTVSQTFPSTSDTALFSFRIFSWEHRGDDIFSFDLRDANGNSGFALSDQDGNPLSIQIGNGPAKTCPVTPCEISIDVGKRGNFLNTGWLVVKVSGLPVDESDVTIEYNITGGQNDALGTWAYFDNANTPPVAKFSFPQDIVEGDPIQFLNESYDPDPGDRIVAWSWSVTNPINEVGEIDTQDTVIEFPDDGNYLISLTVTDSFGASTTVTSGGTALDDTFIPEVWAQNKAPIVSAINQEVVVGEDIGLLARFVDPGYVDSHTGEWDVNGTFPAVIEEELAPVMSAGVATGLTTAPSTAQEIAASLTITDSNGAATSVPFDVHVLDDVSNRWEPNNDLISAHALNSGWSYRAAIDQVGDYDVYEILLPDGAPLPAGSEVLVALNGLSAPLDLLVLSQIASDQNSDQTIPWIRTPNQSNQWGTTGWIRGGWIRGGWIRGGWIRGGWIRGGWIRGGWIRGGWIRGPWSGSPFLNDTMSLSQIPLSEMPFAAPSISGIGGNDLELSELGLDFLDLPGVNVAGFSANRGVDEDSVLVSTQTTGQRIFVVVIGNNGAFGDYSMRVETSEPYDLSANLGDACSGTPLVGVADSTANSQVLFDSGSPETLFLTQKERFKALNQMDETAWLQFQDKLVEIANRADVNGKVVSLPSSIYDAWDIDPCSMDTVNSAAEQIRAELESILQAYPGIKHVVLVGNDNVVPHYRTKDSTVISNERLYVTESLLRPGTPSYASAFAGYDKTDDFYVDFNPVKWAGRDLYIPKHSIGRLVETPDEIVTVIDTFVKNDGKLILGNALVAGYEFFTDGAQEMSDHLSSSLNTTELIGEDWTSDDLRCSMLGDVTIDGACQSHDVNSINGHFTHFAAISAFGWNVDGSNDILTSSEVAASPVNPGMLLNYTLGCHAGLNVPGNASVVNDLGDGTNPNLDFPQAMARHGANFIASTGYGLGDDITVAGTERLLSLFSDELASGGQLGEMLMRAKQRFFTTVSTITDYDFKTSVQTVLYGLPMYEVVPNGMSSPLNSGNNFYDEFVLNVKDEGQDNAYSYTINKNTVLEAAPADEYGTFFSTDGDYQATAWRAVQPRVTRELAGGLAVHGVVITGGDFELISNHDPLLSLPKQEWSGDYDVASVCVNSFWPGVPASINNFVAKDGIKQSMIVLPGQFRCNSEDASVVTGEERLFKGMSVELLRSGLADYDPPVLTEVDLRNQTDGSMDVAVTAFDISQISRIVLLVIDGVNAYSIESTGLSGEGEFALTIPAFVDGSQLVLQVVDGAGNVATWTGGGVGTRAIQVDAGEGQVYSEFFPTPLTATVTGFNDLLLTSDDVFYRWEFGDGSYDFGTLAVNGVISDGVIVDGQGNATFTVEHQYTSDTDVMASVKITDAFGGVGVDDVNLIRCGDVVDFPGYPNLDLFGCGITNSGSNVSITLSVAGEVAADMQFRVFLDLEGKAKNSDPDGNTDVMLKAHGGSVTGMKSLTVDQIDPRTDLFNPQLIRFNFDISELKWKGQYFRWSVETQDGVAGQTSTGHADMMPDTGSFGYTLQ